MRRLRIGLLASWLAMLVGVGACSDLFSVENPSDIVETELDSPQLVGALSNTPAIAAAGIYDSGITRADLIADDIIQPSTQVSQILLDRGELEVFNSATDSYYDDLVAARWRATDATSRIRELVPNPDSHWAVAQGYFWDAIIRVTLADMYEAGTFDGGRPHSPAEVYEMALSLLEQAAQVARASGEAAYEAASYATMARVHRSLFFELDDLEHLNSAAEYAEQALEVQPDFRVEAIYQTPGSSNGIFSSIGEGLQNLGAGPRFADWADPVTGVQDPRVAISEEPVAEGLYGPFYHSYKYPSLDADIPVSRWQEARLILAEHRLVTGDLLEAVQQINAVRQATGLSDFESEDPAEIREQLLYERETEFWLELRNWQDKRYYGIFPERWIESSRELGLDRRLPISLREKNANPNF